MKSIYNFGIYIRTAVLSTLQGYNLVACLVLLSDIDLKKAAKIFAQKYSCGSSVTGPDEIVIQGDVLDDLLDFIPEKWPEVIILFFCHKRCGYCSSWC